ncbi:MULTISPECIES: MocR-like pyridoxine biosynthesis transcription factor PdxR [Bacillus]|uniref:GntR family transcriptional regulator/MocR family aminotransferase n=1 Tax=Bacillus capparidis TaxID=1840411 RepID=A0ABS4CW26_9BACI|nr:MULTISPECIES: PLP-dependent aminotransferase family protein [Bacillus]MBP1081756.1 GntR family transcriptional regulator/MocR family aminotransferase [Bacillus capparidis]MED1096407.1 PLP-dependent aminotransferase family protein [Bacillus capparidis]
MIRQVYNEISGKILDGSLPAGEKLPSSRELAKAIHVSRNVVLEAYDLLMVEGFVFSKKGSVTYVAEGAFLKREYWEQPVSSPIHSVHKKEMIHFRSGIPDLRHFPRKIWARLSQAVWTEISDHTLGYGSPEGAEELRRELVSYLLKTRGVKCSKEQIVITSGATQALTIVGRMLLREDDPVVLEDPITDDIQQIFKNAGGNLYPVSVDEEGLDTSLLPENVIPAFTFVTPSHQFPLGGTLSIQRRIELLQFARKTNSYVVEDDYDSEFRYDGPPLSTLQRLDPHRVIYIGSFSKILSPALRIGYIILPSNLVEKCRSVKWFSDLHTPAPEQLVLARFLAAGHMDRYVSKMKKVYRQRRDLIINKLKEAFPADIQISGHSTGLHFIADFPFATFSENDLLQMEEDGVKLYSVEQHAITRGIHKGKLVIGYGHLNNEEIQQGIRCLKNAIDRLM